MKLKRLSLFLALVMILSAFAGTFTFTFAETTAKVWEVNGTSYATLTEAFTNIGEATTIYLTGDYTVAETATIKPTINAGTTITITSKDNGNYVISNASIRFLQLTTAGTLKLKNLTLNTASGSYGVIQINAGIVELDNVKMTTNNSYAFVVQGGGTLHVTNGSVLHMEGNGQAIRLNEAGATAKVENSTITRTTTTAGTPHLIWYQASTTEKPASCEITNTTLSVTSPVSTSTTGAIVGFRTDADTTLGAKLKISGSILDVSNAPRFRTVYASGSVCAMNISFDNTLFKGGVDTNDVMQLSSNVTFTLGENLGFIGGGEGIVGTTKPLIIRGYDNNSLVYPGNSTMKVVNRSSKYETDMKFFEAFGAVAVSGTNYDEVAASMGFKMRIGDAATAYDNGTFSGYYTSVNFAENDATAGDTITLITNATWGLVNTIGKAVTIDLNQKILSTNGAYVRFANVEADLTIKNGTINGVGNAGNMFRLQNTATGIALTLQNVNINLTAATGTTSLIQPLGDEQIINFVGNVNVIAKGAIHAFIDNYGTKQVVNVTNANMTVVNFSRFMYTETVTHYTGAGDSDGEREDIAIDKTTLNVTGSVINTDAWGGFFQSTSGTSVVNLENSDIMMPKNQYFLRISAGKAVTVNGATITNSGSAEDYYMPTNEILTGASVRIAKSTDVNNELANSGLRFESKISATINADVEALMESGAITSAKVGTVIFRVSDKGTKTVAQLVNDANASDSDDLKVADIPCVNGYVENADNSITVRAALVNIKEANYSTDFGAVAYIEYTLKNGETVRIYGTFNSTNNVRSIAAVAQAALADTKTTAQITENDGSAIFDGYNYYNEIEEGVFSCYSDEQIAILNAYAATRQD